MRIDPTPNKLKAERAINEKLAREGALTMLIIRNGSIREVRVNRRIGLPRPDGPIWNFMRRRGDGP